MDLSPGTLAVPPVNAQTKPEWDQTELGGQVKLIHSPNFFPKTTIHKEETDPGGP